jgi:RNA polymerase I-specific transcription initiation factor RRN3
MHVLFEHIRAQANSTEYGGQGVYQMISPVFDSSVLTTHRSKFVQFVVFVVCGLENEGVSLDREFAAKLIDIVLDPYRATVTRQSGACYLASFMSRASYVSPETICEAISALLRWAEAYMLSLGEYGARASDVRDQCDLHSLFYTVCQASFYMMCFRGTEAMQYYRSAMEYHSTHSVNELEPNVEIPYADLEHVDIGPARWAKICGHELQPLRFCLESVRGEFLHVASVFRLLPPQLLERLAADDLKMSTAKMSTPRNKPRKSAIITTAATLAKRRMKGGVGGLGRGSNPLDSFFPFDPYLLRRSHIFVDPFYKNWEGGVDCHYHDGNDDDENEEEEEEEGAYNDDDSESSGDEASLSEEDEGEKGTHMPQSMDSAAYVGPMSHASNATFMSNSTKSSFQLGTPEISTKKQLQQEAWSETLKRPRASSIENGSW